MTPQQTRTLSPPELLMELALVPLRSLGALSDGLNFVAQGRGQKNYRRHSAWGYYIPTTTTSELDDEQIFG